MSLAQASHLPALRLAIGGPAGAGRHDGAAARLGDRPYVRLVVLRHCGDGTGSLGFPDRNGGSQCFILGCVEQQFILCSKQRGVGKLPLDHLDQ